MGEKRRNDLPQGLQIAAKPLVNAFTGGISFYVYIVSIYLARTSRKSHELPRKKSMLQYHLKQKH